MRLKILLVLLLLPSMALAQSLGELARKERERREKNKEQGKTAIEISEDDLYPEGRPEPEAAEAGDTGNEGAAAAAAERRPEASTSEYTDEELETLEDGDVPTFISPDAPLEQRIETFERMRRQFERQAREIDAQISKNEERIAEIRREIATTSAAGGAGLPVPQTGTEAVNGQMTGQESQTLVAEQNRLEAMNEQLAAQKEKLRYDLQQKGRAAGIPPGYLRF